MRTLQPADSWTAHRALLEEELDKLSGLRFALIYGSAAAGEPFHDLDIALFVERTVHSRHADIDLAFDLADTLELRLPFPVDVRVINDAPLPFSYNVSRGKPLLVNDYPAYYTWLERTWDMWFDFKPIADQYLRDMA